VHTWDVGLDGVVPKVAKRCCYQVRTCATSIEALVIASVVLVVDFAGCVRQPLKASNGHDPVLGSLVVSLCHAKMVLGPKWRGVAVETGLLCVVARGHCPGCHAANTSHAVCVGLLSGPLNSRVGSAIENATVVSAGWVAWRRARNVRRVELARRLNHASLSCAWFGQRK
jgi:hypothetical protein